LELARFGRLHGSVITSAQAAAQLDPRVCAGTTLLQGASATYYCFSNLGGACWKTSGNKRERAKGLRRLTNAEQVHRLAPTKTLSELLGGVAATYALNDAGAPTLDTG
jgi:hypothetical protein